ncbi:MAG: hypothetical protein ACOX8V_01005 [Thermoleophilia bacterium]
MPSFLVTLLWVAFAALWIFSQNTLNYVFDWIQGLSLVAEIIVWILFLPWVAALWIWHADWPFWLRLILIFGIALATIGGAHSRDRSQRKA